MNDSFRTTGLEVSTPPTTSGWPGNNVEHSLRHPGPFCKLGESKRGIRRGFRGLDYQGAARGQRGSRFAGNHRIGKVPGGDYRHHTDRLFDYHDAPVRGGSSNDIPVDTLCLFSKPLDKCRAIGNFASRLSEGFALLQGKNGRQVILILHAQIEPATEDLRSLLGRLSSPGRQSRFRRIDGASRVRNAETRNRADLAAIRRIGDGENAAVFGAGPRTVDVALLAEQLLVFKVHFD